MTLRTNNAEGGTNGTNVTTANSGGASGNAFNFAQALSGATVTFDNTQKAHGTLSYRIQQTTGPQTAYVGWNYTAASSVAVREYVRLNTFPTTTQALMSVGPAINFQASTHKLFFQPFDTNTLLFPTALSTGVWYRIELEVAAGTTTANGYAAARYFIGDSTTPVDTPITTSTANTGTGAAYSNVVYAANTTSLQDFWLDDLAVQDGTTTPITPIAPTVVPFTGWGIPL